MKNSPLRLALAVPIRILARPLPLAMAAAVAIPRAIVAAESGAFRLSRPATAFGNSSCPTLISPPSAIFRA